MSSLISQSHRRRQAVGVSRANTYWQAEGVGSRCRQPTFAWAIRADDTDSRPLARHLAAWLMACLLVCSLVGVAPAQELNPPEIVELRVGFNGQYKVGMWTPVEVTLRGGSEQLTGQLELTVADGDGTPSRVVSSLRQLQPGQQTPVLLYVKFGELNGEMNAVFRVGRRAVIDHTFRNYDDNEKMALPMALSTASTLIVSVGASLGVEHEQQQTYGYYGAPRTVVARVDDASQLPSQWYGYEGVDTLVLSTSQPDMYSKLVETSQELTAIDEWVRRGGKLVLFAGSQAPVMLTPGAALARFAPGRFDDSVKLSRSTALENYSGAGAPLARVGGTLSLQVPRFQAIGGVTVVREGDLPLVIRSPRAFGEIVFVGLDHDRAPLADWKGREGMLRKLLDLPQRKEDADQAMSYQGMNYGISDLAGQLRGALDNFGIKPISFGIVALLIFVYILFIGPGDYFLVKKLLKRMELTWITFPLIVVLVSVGAYGLAYWTKGADLRLNQAEVVDVDVESGLVRGTAWLNVFSPRTASYEVVSVAPRMNLQAGGGDAKAAEAGASDDAQVLMSWMGNPGTGWGGLDRRGSQPMRGRGGYTFGPALESMLNVPIQVWSTKTFASQYSYDARPPMSAELKMDAGGVPEGTIKSDLPFALHDCMLLSGQWAYDVGDLKPGGAVSLVSGKQRDLKHILREVRQEHDVKSKTYVQTSTPYQPDSRNVPAILRQMMFYQEVGGREYTQLLDSYQSSIDMSALLTLNRAVLVGMAEQPGAELTNEGKPFVRPGDEYWQHWTFYRFVFPIKPAKDTTP